MLLNDKGREVKTADRFNSAEVRVAVLAPLREVLTYSRRGHSNWFTIEQRANLRPGR